MHSKVTSSAPKVFQPVSVEITFTSQEELDKFGALMNCNPIYRIVGTGELWQTLKNAGANIGGLNPNCKKVYEIFNDFILKSGKV